MSEVELREITLSWLTVPHLKQAKSSWCLPACVAMATAYLQQPLLQDDIARWLGTDDVGTPASRVQRMNRRGFEVVYNNVGSLADLESWLKRQIPPILFVRTGELDTWSADTQHAIILVGLTATEAHIFDPANDTTPVTVLSSELLLAWSYFDYTYAALLVAA